MEKVHSMVAKNPLVGVERTTCISGLVDVVNIMKLLTNDEITISALEIVLIELKI